MIKLWIYRLQKLLETEKKGVHQYNDLITACEMNFQNSKVLTILKQIRGDEELHSELAEEALGIAHKYDRLAKASQAISAK